MTRRENQDEIAAAGLRPWWRLALRRDIVLRSRKVALLVGTILVAINYGDRLLRGDLAWVDGIKMLLTYCVPYCVSTYAAVSAIRTAAVPRDAH